jgi:hypothetical protein
LKRAYFVGLDLGQARDFTAVAVLERVGTASGRELASRTRGRAELQVRHLERVGLGTSYPEIVRLVRGMTEAPELQGQVHLAVDATGVGQAVVDLLRRAKLRCRMWPATTTVRLNLSPAV